MEFTCNTYIIDAIMGAGKTSAIINKVNNSGNEKYLIITPFLDEVKRYIERCPSKHFKQPRYDEDDDGNKIAKYDDVKRLLENGENVVCTHSLFHKFNAETVGICKSYGYNLILDEVAEVIEEWKVTKYDFDNLVNNYVSIDKKTRRVIWKEEYKNYRGEFDKYKIACDNGSLASFDRNFMVWLFPVSVFNAFENVYILTYSFDAQYQRCYYDFYGLPYKYLGVTGNSVETYKITNEKDAKNTAYSIGSLYDYSKLIHICENDKMNAIGLSDGSLSVTWYEKRKNDIAIMKILKNNMINYFNNICHGASKDNLWTTYKAYKNILKGMNYTKGFIPMNMRATNDYRERKNIAYMVNRYMQPYLKNFFLTADINVNEDKWALSEMLQLIWRSEIRSGKEIWIYIPSKRMRTLLQNWIDEVSLEYKNNTEVKQNGTATTGL